jgi:hypothetical protein
VEQNDPKGRRLKHDKGRVGYGDVISIRARRRREGQLVKGKCKNLTALARDDIP